MHSTIHLTFLRQGKARDICSALIPPADVAHKTDPKYDEVMKHFVGIPDEETFA